MLDHLSRLPVGALALQHSGLEHSSLSCCALTPHGAMEPNVGVERDRATEKGYSMHDDQKLIQNHIHMVLEVSLGNTIPCCIMGFDCSPDSKHTALKLCPTLAVTPHGTNKHPPKHLGSDSRLEQATNWNVLPVPAKKLSALTGTQWLPHRKQRLLRLPYIDSLLSIFLD